MPTDTDNTYNLILASATTGLDTTTGSYTCTHGGSCTNTTNTTDYAINIDQRDLRSDGIWDRTFAVGDGQFTFHVRAQDKAGNFGNTTHYSIKVDSSGPSTPQMINAIKVSNLSQLTFNWTEATDIESGVSNYSLQVDNNSDFSSPEFNDWVGNRTNYTVTGLTANTAYHARVLAQNQAGVNGSASNTVSQTVDTTAPIITLSKPSGTVVSTAVTIVAKTNEKSTCQGRESPNAYTSFAYTNTTYHETRVTLGGTGARTFDIKCQDSVGNEATVALSITVDTTATAGTVTLQTPTAFTDSVVVTNITVKTSGGTNLGEIPKTSFDISIGSDHPPFSLFDAGAGVYTAQFRSPLNNGSYAYTVSVGDASATSTLTVNALNFIVQYTDSSIIANTARKLIYNVAGNFSIGLASDSRSVGTSSNTGGLNISANARDGDVFVFVTRSSGNVERIEELLVDRTFMDAVSPSFGYQLDQETFIVFTDLEYADIALTANSTLTTGRYTLIIENHGFDSTLNKTRFTVKVT
jgi:hypothetical protein